MLTLCALGQPEKAIGHEPQIEPWLTHRTTAALASFRNRSASSLLKKMHLLRWNNISTQVRGAQHQTCVFYGEGGWKPRKCFPAPVEGEIFSLTFPFIEQRLHSLTLVVSEMFQQLSGFVVVTSLESGGI